MDAKFLRSFTTVARDGVGVELKWSGHRDLKAMRHDAPLFGVGVGSSRYKQQVEVLGERFPGVVEVEMLLRLKQRRSSSLPSEFSLSLNSVGPNAP